MSVVFSIVPQVLVPFALLQVPLGDTTSLHPVSTVRSVTPLSFLSFVETTLQHTAGKVLGTQVNCCGNMICSCLLLQTLPVDTGASLPSPLLLCISLLLGHALHRQSLAYHTVRLLPPRVLLCIWLPLGHALPGESLTFPVRCWWLIGVV